MITEPGPDKILAQNTNKILVASIKKRVRISVEKHKSQSILIVGHHDCAGNPVDAKKHHLQIKKSVETVKKWGYSVPVMGAWIDRTLKIREA